MSDDAHIVTIPRHNPVNVLKSGNSCAQRKRSNASGADSIAPLRRDTASSPAHDGRTAPPRRGAAAYALGGVGQG
jgi:hypothetical protein